MIRALESGFFDLKGWRRMSLPEMHLYVSDISCGHCVDTIKKELESVPGVAEVEISLDDKLVTVKSRDELSSDAVMTAIRGAGYTPELRG